MNVSFTAIKYLWDVADVLAKANLVIDGDTGAGEEAGDNDKRVDVEEMESLEVEDMNETGLTVKPPGG